MWTTSYILSQVLVFIGVILLAVSYLVKNKIMILILCFSSGICYMLQYFFLGAFAGIIVNLIGLIRVVWLFFDEKYNLKDRFVILISLSLMIIIFVVMFYRGPQDIFVLIASLMFNYSMWQKDIKIYRWMSIFISALYITYNVLVFTILGTIF